MKKKRYLITTETCLSWCETLGDAIVEFAKSVSFYENRTGYGSRVIKLLKDDSVICEYPIIKFE